MQQGSNIYYRLQHKLIAKTEHNDPNGPLIPQENDWAFSCHDYFGRIAEPWAGTGNDYKPMFRDSHDETHDVWSRTGQHGWWTLDYALAALSRLIIENDKHAFINKGPYGETVNRCKYKFRIVKVELSYNYEPI